MSFESKRESALAKLTKAIEAAEAPSQIEALKADIDLLFNGPVASGPYTPPGEGGGNGEPPDPP